MGEETSFFKRAQSAAKFALPTYWKLATIRCTIYALMVGWGSFQTGVEGYDTFSMMSQMQFCKFIGNIAISMLGVWLAFLDQTMTKIKDVREDQATSTLTHTESIAIKPGDKPQ